MVEVRRGGISSTSAQASAADEAVLLFITNNFRTLQFEAKVEVQASYIIAGKSLVIDG